MTLEQLDEIEKLADEWDRTGLTQYAEKVADNALPLVKALREALSVSKSRREEAFDWISAYFEAQRERDEARNTQQPVHDYQPHETVGRTEYVVKLEREFYESRAEVAKLRAVLAEMDRIAEEMEQAATPHGYTGQMVRAYSKWATKISEALDSVRLP